MYKILEDLRSSYNMWIYGKAHFGQKLWEDRLVKSLVSMRFIKIKPSFRQLCPACHFGALLSFQRQSARWSSSVVHGPLIDIHLGAEQRSMGIWGTFYVAAVVPENGRFQKKYNDLTPHLWAFFGWWYPLFSSVQLRILHEQSSPKRFPRLVDPEKNQQVLHWYAHNIPHRLDKPKCRDL